MALFKNMYFQAFALSFLSVCIIRYFLIKLFVGILQGISVTKAVKREIFFQQYLYWFFPLLFALVLPFIRPIDINYFFNLIVYYCLILLIYNSLFKTIVTRLEERIKKL